MRTIRLRTIFLLAMLLSVAVSHADEPALTVKPNDVWVMAGDSITAQRLHSNFIEAFYRTRYPNLNLHFRNSGIGGNRTNHILARFDYDVAAWKPTIVSIELGMNDVGGGDDPKGYIDGMRQLIQKIRALPAQPVLISSSPVNDGSLPDQWKSDRCRRLHPYTEALQKLAAEEKVVFVDQYHPLLVLWGNNKLPPEPAAAAPAVTPPAVTTPTAPAAPVPPTAPVRPRPPADRIPLGGDPVHPGDVGQYTMAATILAALKVDREVSAATVRADGTVVEVKRCKISDAARRDGKLTFTRLDEAGPWPIALRARAALDLMPAMADLSRYTLTVPDLAPGRYRVAINGQPAAVLTEKELAAGWNMTTVFQGALAERSTTILGLIRKLQTGLNQEWRAASKAKDQAKLDAAQKAIEECETQLQAACQPQPLRFEIEMEK